jgi:hypothetical protein
MRYGRTSKAPRATLLSVVGSETSSRFSIRIDENRSALLSQRTVKTRLIPARAVGSRRPIACDGEREEQV